MSSGPSAIDVWLQRQADEARHRRSLDPELAAAGLAALREAVAPARKQEPWRYTDLRALFLDEPPRAASAASEDVSSEAVSSFIEEAFGVNIPAAARLVFVDGVFAPTLSSGGVASEADDFVGAASHLAARAPHLWESVADLLRPLPEKDIFPSSAQDALGCATLAALNQATLEDCACVLCPGAGGEAGEVLTVQVLFVTTGGGSWPAASSPRLLVEAGTGRRLQLVECHLSMDPSDSSFSNGLSRVVLRPGSRVEHELLQQKADGARFVESLTAEVDAGAEYQLRVVQSGSRVGRANIAVALQGEGSSCKVIGVALADGRQQLDVHSLIHHSVPGCTSEQLHKSIVGGVAESIFKGSIRVDKEAQRTDSSQLCKTLLLSKRARAKAMPSLQIQADDVSCSHGAAVTELAKDIIFYMQSRGLDATGARRLLSVAFPQDALGDLAERTPGAHRAIVEKLETMAAAA